MKTPAIMSILVATSAWACSTTPDATVVDAGNDVAKKDAFVAPDDDAGPTFRVSGTVVDTTTKPYEGAAVQVCGTVCIVAFADPQGAWAADGIVPEPKHLRVEGKPSDGRSWTPVVYHIDVAADLVVAAPTIVPETPPPVTLTAGLKTQTAGDVALTFDDAKLTQSSHLFASVKIAKAAWPPYDAKPKTLVAMWGMLPFGAKSSVPIPVSLDVTGLGLVANEKVSVFAVDADSGLLTDETPATVSSDGNHVTTENGTGLNRISWIVLAK